MGLGHHGLVGDGLLHAVCGRPGPDTLFQCRQDPAALRHSQRGRAGVLLRGQFRVQLRHAAILRDAVEHGDPADRRLAQGRLRIHHQPDRRPWLWTKRRSEFVPAARFARKLGENLAVGVEYYTDLGPLQSWLPFNEQQHNIYAVVDFKIGRFDVNAGVGYGLTPGSDRLMYKMIIGTDLTEGVSDKSNEGSKTLRRPESRLSGSFRP